MSTSKRRKHRRKIVVAGMATVAALAGGAGVAAASGPPAATDKPASSPTEGAKSVEGAEQTGAQEKEPSLNGSQRATEVAGENDQQEQSRLTSEAKVSKSAAEAAALKSAPGTVTSSEVGNENGSLIWEVGVKKADGSTVEIKVDAGDGKVLAQKASDEGSSDGGKGSSGSQNGEQDTSGEATTG